MPELFLLKNEIAADIPLTDKPNEVTLHKDILKILFKYKENICFKFDDIRGTFLIDHLAINIIDPNNKIIIFSTTPSVEYNLITQNLWKHDKGFSIDYQKDNRFYSWEKAYEKEYFDKLKLTKQTNHGFTFGFNLSKKNESFQLIYSFATRHQKIDFAGYYSQYINELFAIGDYGYKAISHTYQQQIGKISSSLNIIQDKNPHFSPFLKLIINNEI